MAARCHPLRSRWLLVVVAVLGAAACVQLAAAQLDATAAAAAAEPARSGYRYRPPGRKDCAPGRKALAITSSSGRTSTLCLPRELAAPLHFGNTTTFLRTVNDTCGLFTLLRQKPVPAGRGVAPHLHYADAEYFLPTGGDLRIFHPQKLTNFKPSHVPGFTTSASVEGSVVVRAGEVFYSPPGNVHYWQAETDIDEIYMVPVPGFAALGVYSVDPTTYCSPREFFFYTGLIGSPIDQTGTFVGTKDFWSIRGPAARPPYSLSELQRLFDKGDACCGSACA